jgi:hypothetical protein
MWRPDSRLSQQGYFPADEPGLTSLLDAFLRSLRDDLASRPISQTVCSLMLAGGYGRGEGGIYREHDAAAAHLYNDLEFFMVVANRSAIPSAEEWCREQGARGEHELGIEVEFKVITDLALRRTETSMFIYDLLAAHRLVYGSENFVRTLPPTLSDPAVIPRHEAARLLFNRGSGLLFSFSALRAGDDRIRNGFVERNHAKLRMALADAVLAVNGRYHFSCLERHRRLCDPSLEVPPDWPELMAWHEEGVTFKFHPRHRYPSEGELKETQEKIARVWLHTFLWVESLRLHQKFSDAEHYAKYAARLFPEMQPWRNLAVHLRDRWKRGASLASWFDYPRAALQRALVLLIHGPCDFEGAAAAMGLPFPLEPERVLDRYHYWWEFYN